MHSFNKYLIDTCSAQRVATCSIGINLIAAKWLIEEGSRSSRHGKPAEKMRKFEENLNSLFDIAACQCKDMSECICEKEMNVPQRERAFLMEQSLMQIGGVDKKVTAMMERRSRQERMTERKEEKRKASWVCHLYVSTESPSPELSLPTKFVVCHYGPLWFRMKCHPRCTDGSRHFLEQIILQRMFPMDVKNMVLPIIQKNSYWAHEENVLLAMLADDDFASRQGAIDRIENIRQVAVSTQQQVREFLPPKVDESVETLTDLLSPECTFEPPPLLPGLLQSVCSHSSAERVSEWVSSCLTAHQHNIGHGHLCQAICYN